jgi:hypothetical protein
MRRSLLLSAALLAVACRSGSSSNPTEPNPGVNIQTGAIVFELVEVRTPSEIDTVLYARIQELDPSGTTTAESRECPEASIERIDERRWRCPAGFTDLKPNVTYWVSWGHLARTNDEIESPQAGRRIWLFKGNQELASVISVGSVGGEVAVVRFNPDGSIQ